jgi:hypothetical protein
MKMEYLKDRINGLETNSKSKNIRDIYGGTNKFQKGHHHKTNKVKDVKGNPLADLIVLSNR